MVDVDAHFGWSKNIVIYEVRTDSSQLLEIVQFADDRQDDVGEDKLEPKLEAIRDCAILYVAAMGGSAAAKVVKLKVHPIKVPEGKTQSIAEIILRLQEVLKGSPPPWLRKALLRGGEPLFDN